MQRKKQMDDLISRQDAIDAIKEEEYPCESDYDEGYMAALKKSVWIMEKWLPSAQPEPKTGKWIDTGSGQECSVCGEIQYGYDNFRRFCGNCGADMRSKKDGK